MNNMSKVLIASALTVAFAAPAFADESATQRERNAFANPAGAGGQVEAVYGTDAFASANMPSRTQRGWIMAQPSNDWSGTNWSGKTLGISRER